MKFKINNLTPFLLAALQNPAFAAGEPQQVTLNIGGTLSVPPCPGFDKLEINLGEPTIDRIRAYAQPEDNRPDYGSYKVRFPGLQASACPSQNALILELEKAEITPDSGTDHASGIKLLITQAYTNKSNQIIYTRSGGNSNFSTSGTYIINILRSGAAEDVKPGTIRATVTAKIKIQ